MRRMIYLGALLMTTGCVADRDSLADYCDPSNHCHVQHLGDAYGSPQQRLDTQTRTMDPNNPR